MTKPMNNVISLLGVQGLSRNNYSVVQLKVVLAIIGHAQKVIKDYVVDGQMPNKSMRKRLTARQMADGYVVVVIRLSDLCAHTSRYSQVKNAIVDMAKRKPIAIPYKCDVNQVTYYAEFPRLFSCEFIRMGGHLAVEFRFSNDLLDYFYSFDKGVTHIKMDVVNQCRSAASIKLYIITHCWAIKGYTRVDPRKFVALMHGREDYYKYYCDLNLKTLQPALADQKRLYDLGVVDQYVTMSACYPQEDGQGDERHVGWPAYLIFTVHYHMEEEGLVSADLLCQRLQLKIRLMHFYDVSEAKAIELSNRLSMGMLGDFICWFERKEQYVAECIRKKMPMKKTAYIVSALRGFFKDRGCSLVRTYEVSSPSKSSLEIPAPGEIPVAKPFPPVPSNLKNDWLMQDANHNNNMMMGKADLALQYFPMAGDKITARRHLMSWIKRCPPLWEGIRQLGYHQRCQYFSPKWCN